MNIYAVTNEKRAGIILTACKRLLIIQGDLQRAGATHAANHADRARLAALAAFRQLQKKNARTVKARASG